MVNDLNFVNLMSILKLLTAKNLQCPQNFKCKLNIVFTKRLTFFYCIYAIRFSPKQNLIAVCGVPVKKQRSFAELQVTCMIYHFGVFGFAAVVQYAIDTTIVL